MRRSSFALAAVVVSGIVAVAPAAGVPEQTPKRGGTVVIGLDGDSLREPARVRAAHLHLRRSCCRLSPPLPI